MKTYSLILFVLLSAFFGAGRLHAADSGSIPEFPSIPVIAHRGVSGYYPENSVSSLQAAIDSDVPGAEFDVKKTADGKLILFHDSDAKRFGGDERSVDKLTFEEIRKLDLSKVKKGFEKFAGEKVPSLEEALILFKNSQCRPVIEIKDGGIEKPIIDLIRKHGLEKKAVIIDFSWKRVKIIRALAPEIPVAWLCSFKKEEMSPDEIAKIILNTLKKCNTNTIDISYGSLTPELLKILRDANIRVLCWTADKPDDIQRMIDWKVESITTNYPDRVDQLKKQTVK
ncbi:MAG: glycerophosphodiester phosphodiesterase family protein [Planctomycetia bacterium]|nr:glycerophosphodiester phosphodiesterase family protein [Planctomycetia bacterium]